MVLFALDEYKNAPVHLTLLGEFSCQSSQSIGFAARTAAEVFAYLAIHRNRWVPRSELAEAIWPGTDEKVARTNLRKAVQRVRESLGNHEVLLKNSDSLTIDRKMVICDLDEAEQLHRHYAFAPHLQESVEKLYQEWLLLDKPLLDGWDSEWVCEERKNFEVRAHELGLRLLEALESVGMVDQCLEVLNTMMLRSPMDYELLQRAIRLSAKSNRDHTTSQLIEKLLSELPPQSEIPRPVKRLIQRVQQGQMDQVPAPELFETRNELALLARMVESNLKSNSSEAMAMLAKESSNIENWAHAKTLLSILTVALEHSAGHSDDEILVATNACFLATYASDFLVGQWAARRVLDVLPESDPRSIRVMSVLAFLNFETKNYEESRRLHNQSVELCHRYGAEAELSRVLNRLAVLDYHLGNFDAAQALFDEAIERENQNPEDTRLARLASFHGNYCTMEVLRGRWESARHHGALSMSFAERSAKIYQIFVSSGYGLALLNTGDRKGIMYIIDGIVQTARERMRRFNMISIDFGVAALAELRQYEPAVQIAALNRVIREAGGYPRCPAEVAFVRNSFDPAGRLSVAKMQPMSLVALSRWVVEELETLKD